ncbi:hypothetical protein E2C01_079640 [Portunus trituberculatus]|uniref:Uncharacterized protein n=1 Tax=Portunus trituberculatus TaxID=210409 RepID=A0A5B7IRX2_PORTR|nr:hypothetical protein [Portunus trituberculatus]
MLGPEKGPERRWKGPMGYWGLPPHCLKKDEPPWKAAGPGHLLEKHESVVKPRSPSRQQKEHHLRRRRSRRDNRTDV